MYLYWGPMKGRRVNVTLDPEQAEKLSQLAERAHISEGTLARSLLSTAIDEAEPDPERISGILDGIPGAFERTQHALKQIEQGKTIPLSEL